MLCTINRPQSNCPAIGQVMAIPACWGCWQVSPMFFVNFATQAPGSAAVLRSYAIPPVWVQSTYMQGWQDERFISFINGVRWLKFSGADFRHL